MKRYTRKQAEKILSDKGKFWSTPLDLFRINRESKETQDEVLYYATLDLNGYLLGY